MKHFLFISIAVAVGVVVGGVLLYGVATLSPFTISSGHAGSVRQLEYADFVTIMLTAVSVILAGLGFVIAVLAVIGWNSIGNRVSTLALDFLKKGLEDGGQLQTLIRNEAKSIIYRGVEPIDTDYNEDDEEAGLEGQK